MSDTQASGPPMGKFDESNFKVYSGSCHCGRVKFEAAISPPIEEGKVVSCNCSICHINGYLNVYSPAAKLTLLPDHDTAMKEMTSYGFGKRMVDHYFCKTCGTSIVGRITEKGRDIVGDIWTINSRALADLDHEKLKIVSADGRSY